MKYGEKFTRIFVKEYKQLIPFNYSSFLRQLSRIGNISFNGYTHHTLVVNFSSMVHAATDLIIQLTCGDNGKLLQWHPHQSWVLVHFVQ